MCYNLCSVIHSLLYIERSLFMFSINLDDEFQDLINDVESNKDLIDLLYVDENTICDNYNRIKNDYELIKRIIDNQNKWYEELKKKVYEEIDVGH